MTATSATPAAPPHRGKPLTAIGVEKLKPRAYRYEVGDPGARGLRVIVFPSGAKSFVLRYRFAGRPQKLTIGPVLIGLAAARAEAAKAVYALSQGRDPAAAKRAIKEEQKRAALAVEDTFYSVSERFLQLEGPKLRSAHARRLRLERLIYPEIGARPIADIKRSEIVRLLDKIELSSGPSMADAVSAIIRRTMSWHATRSDDFRSPFVRGMKRVNAKERARERTLNDDEIRKVWRAADALGGPAGPFTQFLLLTAARRSEAAGLRFAELSKGVWHLPASRNKIKRDLVRPLSAAALEAIAKAPRISDEFVFSTGKRALNGFSRFKRTLQAASGTGGWTLHDLRRTARSLLARAGVRSEVAERCLGHALPSIEAVYNRHTFHEEMTHAFEALASLIERIVNPPAADNVTELRRVGG
jgi:integrase